MKIAGNGTGDPRWNVPGLLDHDAQSACRGDDTTTLYASDRDVFLFLVNDAHPIEAGRLPNGDPDLFFGGFYCWNSEVGAKTLHGQLLSARGLHQPQHLVRRGLRGNQHPAFGIRGRSPRARAAPALENFALSSPDPFMTGIMAARARIVARTDEDRQDFLRKRGFSKAETARVIATLLDEEGYPPAAIFDFVQGITKALVVETAPASFLSGDSAAHLEAALSRRLDRITRQTGKLAWY